MISEKFKEYIFEDKQNDIIKGRMVRYRFPNGYGASVIEGEDSYGLELSVLEFSESDYGDTATEFTDDILGFIDDKKRNKIIQCLSKN